MHIFRPRYAALAALLFTCYSANAAMEVSKEWKPDTDKVGHSIYQLALGKDKTTLYLGDINFPTAEDAKDILQTARVTLLDADSLKEKGEIEVAPIAGKFRGKTDVKAINQVYAIEPASNSADELLLLGQTRSFGVSLLKNGKLVAENLTYKGDDKELSSLRANRHVLLSSDGSTGYIAAHGGTKDEPVSLVLEVKTADLEKGEFKPNVLKDATSGFGIALDNDGKLWTSGTDIRSIDSDGKVTTYDVKEAIGEDPSIISLTVEGDTVYALHYRGDKPGVYVFKLKDDKLALAGVVKTGEMPLEVAIDPERKTGFVTEFGGYKVTQFSTEDFKVLDSFTIPENKEGSKFRQNPNSLYLDADKQRLYVSFLDAGVKMFTYDEKAK